MEINNLVDYILQDDVHNRLTPRVVDIAYSAFMIGRCGKNKDDGGPCDWFNDTKQMHLNRWHGCFNMTRLAGLLA